MKRLVKATSILSTVSIGDMLTRFVRTKVIAIFLGPVGTGLYSALTLFLDTLTVMGSLGTRRAVIKQVAEAQKEGMQSPQYRSVIRTSFFLVIGISTLVAFVVFLASSKVSQQLFGDPRFYRYVIIVGLTLPAASLASLFGAILKGNMKYTAFAKYTLAAYFVVLLSTPLIVYYFDVWGALLSQFLFYFLPILAYLVYHFRHPFLYFSKRIHWGMVKEQCLDGFNFVYAETLTSFSRLIVVSWITRDLGLEQMGLYQVVLTFTTVYMSVPMNAVSGYTLPAIAQTEDPVKINKSINDTLRLLFFMLIPIIASLMIWPSLFIDILYSDKFLGARWPLRLQLIGTCFSIISYALGSSLVAKGKLKALYFIATFNSAVYMIAAVLLFKSWELAGAAMAFSISVAATCVLLFFLTRRYFNFRLFSENKRLLFATLAWLFVSLVSAHALSRWYWKLGYFAMAVPWFLVSSTSRERLYLWGKIRGFFVR